MLSKSVFIIILMINKSDSRFAVVDFVNHSYDYRPNWNPLGPINIVKTAVFVSGVYFYRRAYFMCTVCAVYWIIT